MPYRDKEKEKEHGRNYRQEHREKLKAYNKLYRQTHKEELNSYSKLHHQINKEHDKRVYLMTKYSLTTEQVDAILVSQNHRCKICRKELFNMKGCIDHDHRNGKVRGILCPNCNRALGLLQDSAHIAREAARYLEGTDYIMEV